jgi:hypothetical protein
MSRLLTDLPAALSRQSWLQIAEDGPPNITPKKIARPRSGLPNDNPTIDVAREIIWLRNLLAELDSSDISAISFLRESPSIPMAMGNQRAIALVT